jgi:hypothetical protein
MKPEKLFSRHPLDNGLTLEFWNLSRPLAGDRWLVVVEARIAIAVVRAHLPADLVAQEAEICRALGPELVFSQRDERTFVAGADLAATLKEMETRLLTLAPAYFGHPEFASRFIRKKVAEFQEKQRWQSRQTQ